MASPSDVEAECTASTTETRDVRADSCSSTDKKSLQLRGGLSLWLFLLLWKEFVYNYVSAYWLHFAISGHPLYLIYQNALLLLLVILLDNVFYDYCQPPSPIPIMIEEGDEEDDEDNLLDLFPTDAADDDDDEGGDFIAHLGDGLYEGFSFLEREELDHERDSLTDYFASLIDSGYESYSDEDSFDGVRDLPKNRTIPWS